MEPVTVTVTIYIAVKMVDQFISQEGYGFFRKLLFPKQKYVDRLYQLIQETALEHEDIYPIDPDSGNVPFYRSKPLFDILNQHILFTSLPTFEVLLDEFKKYPKVIPPTHIELECFYTALSSKINKCKTLKILHVKETYKEKIFDIGDSLFELKLLVESIDKKLTFTLDKAWLERKSNEAISDLGNRYTPELNLKLEIAEIFEGIGKTNNFSDIIDSKFDIFLIKANKLRNEETIKDSFIKISSNVQAILDLYKNCKFVSINKIPVEEFTEHLDNCLASIQEAEDILWKERKKADEKIDASQFSNKYAVLHRDLREFNVQCSSLKNYLKATAVTLANNPFLLLEGEAGVGKSHLLADVVNTRTSSDTPSLFILGQHLTVEEPPWIQIFKRLELNITSDEFLEKLNLYGKHLDKRIIIFVDAINEGCGNKFWPDHINSFVDGIRRNEWLGLVLSIRTIYKNITISSEQVARNELEQHRHIGFKNVEYDAVNLFLDNYKIERSSAPLLKPEFKNPLFLKLFCEGIKKSGLSKVPKGLEGLTAILDFFISGVNATLSSPKRHGYNVGLNLVKKSVAELIRTKLSLGKPYIPIDIAAIAVQGVVKDYIQRKSFLNDLISEGVLTQGVVREENSTVYVVYTSFERFDDHLTANFLLEGVEDVASEFTDGGKLYEFVKDQNCLYFNQGLIEALSIQLPEKFGVELYEVIPKFRDYSELVIAFINSLLWRKPESIKHEKIRHYINKNVFRDQETLDHFFETVVSLSSVENHPYNADFLHNWLLNQSLPERDASWTIQLKYKYDEESTFRHLIDWAWSDSEKSHISDCSIELASTTLCWFLTSSNRELRDCTTKALVNLLENRIEVLLTLLKKFENVDDPYVIDRVYAVALGCTLRTKQSGQLEKLAELVYVLVFDKENIYSHVLLRDYAREIIEYVAHTGVSLDQIDIQKTHPPYRSTWPEVIPTEKDLEELYDKDKYYHLWSSVMGGGDFSRYTIGTNYNHSSWSGCKFGDEPINRKKIYEDFQNDLTINQRELYETLDPIITEDTGEKIKAGDVTFHYSLAIGRKIEEELSANKQAFKTSLPEDKLKFFESEIEPYLNHNHKLIDTDSHFDLRLAQRIIFNRVIELGWDPKLHLDFDKQVGTGRGRHDSHQERIGKKYQWIAYYEFMAKLADNFIRYEGYGDDRKENPYLGPWDPYVRDIDPTILLKKTGFRNSDNDLWWSSDELFDWDCSFEDWVNDEKTIDNPVDLIEVTDHDGNEWLVLHSYPTWKEPKIIGNEDWGYPRKEVWCHIRSYLVKDSEFEKFKDWLGEQHFMGNWMPHTADLYQLFNREYYWSNAFNSFQTPYYGVCDWEEVLDQNTREYVAKVSNNSINYLWEEEFDHSKAEVLSFLKPSALLVEMLALKPGDEEGTFVDDNGNFICFSTEVLHNTEAHLLVKKKELLEMLEENNMKIAWTLLGEKGVIGGSISSNHSYGRIEFSGAFFVASNKVEGSLKIYPNDQ